MATPPVFTSGSVLTAAQMNAVGLWRVTTCTVTSVGGTAATASNGVITVGSGNTSLTIASAFSSDYDNYIIEYSGGVGSANVHINLRLGSSITNYYGGLIYTTVANPVAAAAIDNNSSAFSFAMGGNTSQVNGNVTLLAPNKAIMTVIAASNQSYTNFGNYNGYHAVASAYTDFSLIVSGGSISGGTICVYGYRK